MSVGLALPPARDDRPAVLIVDDHETNLRLYRAILKDSGAELLTARTGEEALQIGASRTFAVTLLDVHLAGMNGFDVARQLQAASGAAASPIVFISAVYTHDEDAFHGYRLGAVDYIHSPVVPEILRSKVAVFIRLQRLRHRAQASAEAMQNAYRELRGAYTELEHFSYSASHDLRTPLAQIVSFVDLLRLHAGPRLDAKSDTYLEHVLKATQRMNEQIDDLLHLGRMTRGDLHPQPIDLSALAREVANELRQTEPLRPVEWHFADDLRADGDPQLLRAAVANLLGNAFKYSAGAEVPRIEFGHLDTPGETVYYVRDNGVGFDVTRAGERLFRPFQRFHGDERFKGNGVGLAIAQRAVTKHGGKIWVESAPGRGASFYFTLRPPAETVRPVDLTEVA